MCRCAMCDVRCVMFEFPDYQQSGMRRGFTSHIKHHTSGITHRRHRYLRRSLLPTLSATTFNWLSSSSLAASGRVSRSEER